MPALLIPHLQCEVSTLEGIKSCMTFYPRACGSMRVRTSPGISGGSVP